jgi:hypothetical protein
MRDRAVKAWRESIDELRKKAAKQPTKRAKATKATKATKAAELLECVDTLTTLVDGLARRLLALEVENLQDISNRVRMVNENLNVACRLADKCGISWYPRYTYDIGTMVAKWVKYLKCRGTPPVELFGIGVKIEYAALNPDEFDAAYDTRRINDLVPMTARPKDQPLLFKRILGHYNYAHAPMQSDTRIQCYFNAIRVCADGLPRSVITSEAMTMTAVNLDSSDHDEDDETREESRMDSISFKIPANAKITFSESFDSTYMYSFGCDVFRVL